MNRALSAIVAGCIIAILQVIPVKVNAQGPPVPVQNAQIQRPVKLAELPLPGQTFDTGLYVSEETFSEAGMRVLDFLVVQAGVAKNLRLNIGVENGIVHSLDAISNGDKNFQRLYKQVQFQVGSPYKLTKSGNQLRYTWAMRTQLGGLITLEMDEGTKLARLQVILN